MNLITIACTRRECDIVLWQRDKVVDKLTSNNVSKELIYLMNELLIRNSLKVDTIERIGFLSGPGSFTSARLGAASCAGIKSAFPQIMIVPATLDNAIHLVPRYNDVNILLRCNLQTWHYFSNDSWTLLPNSSLKDLVLGRFVTFDPAEISGHRLEWPDISYGLMRYSYSIAIQLPIIPFYGTNF